MARRPQHRHEIRQGRIVDWPANAPASEVVAERARYQGSPLHKSYPSPAGPPALRADKAKCDYYAPEQWPQLLEALQQGIRLRSTGSFRGEFPERVWVWINDVLHEARLTNVVVGDYHGFPINDVLQYPLPVDRLEAAPRVTIPAHPMGSG